MQTPSENKLILIDFMTAVGAVIVAAAVVVLTLQLMSVTASSQTNETWYLIRSAGITAYVLFALSMIWGLLLSTRVVADLVPGQVSLLLHGTLSWMSVFFAAAHGGLLLVDTFYQFTLRDLLIPFIGPYRPFAVGLGVIALWIAALVSASFAIRKIIGVKTWRWLHYTSYGGFVAITLHTLMAGADAGDLGMRVMICALTAITFGLLIWRMKAHTRSNSPEQLRQGSGI